MIIGERFSQVYLDKGTPTCDSIRMRNRVSAAHWEILHSNRGGVIKLIQQETGAKVPYVGAVQSLASFFEQCEIRDFLDSITIIYKYYENQRMQRIANSWHVFIIRVFKEENVGYQLDEMGGVHFYVDEEFERNKVSVISCLDNHPAVLDKFSKAYAFLDADPADTSNAVTSIFEALEILYKHTIHSEGKDRLNSHGVQSKLKPLFQQLHHSNPIETTATNHLLDGFCDWIEAGHMYRHGQKVDQPMSPSIDFAVLYISQGASYLRTILRVV